MMIVNYRASKTMVLVAVVSAMVLGLSLGIGAQGRPGVSETLPGTSPGIERQQGQAIPPEARHPLALSAKLVDTEKKAQKQEATVEVQVAGVQLVDSAKVNEQPALGQGHLHYQVDNGPVIATTALKLSFHELSPGPHKITVELVGNDHQPLGPQESLMVTIPQGDKSRAQRR